MNLAFNETMSFEIHIMSSETSLSWQSRSLVRDSGSKGNKWTKETAQLRRVCAPHLIDKLNFNDFHVKSVQIYSRLSLKPMVIGHRGNQISCQGREMFVGSNLVLQWVPGRGKVVRGDTKMSPGRVLPGVLQRGVTMNELFF